MKVCFFVLFIVALCVSLSFAGACFPPEPGAIHRGDVNCSGGEPNVTDVIILDEFVNDTDPNWDPVPCCFEGADVNGDNFISNLDVVSLAAYLFNGCTGCLAAPHCPCSL